MNLTKSPETFHNTEKLIIFIQLAYIKPPEKSRKSQTNRKCHIGKMINK